MKNLFVSVGHKLLCLFLAWGIFACSGDKTETTDTSFNVPVEYYKLKNGLKVVLIAGQNGAYSSRCGLLQHWFPD